LSNDDKSEVSPAAYHFELSDLLLKDKDSIAIEVFREGAKTQYAIRSFVLYSIVYPNRDHDYIVIIKKNQDQASAKLKELQDEYASNDLIRHNLVEIREQSARVFSLDVKDEHGEIHNIRIEAYGKGTAIRGLANKDRRPKIVILDDIQDSEDSRSEAILARDWDWFLSDIIFLGKYTRIFLIGNNLGEKCVIERVQANAEELGYKAVKIPIIKDGVPAWSTKYSIEEIEKEKEQFARLGKLDIWYAEKMCIAVAQETRIFQEEDYRYYAYNMKQEIASMCNVFSVLDPASSTRSDACYRAIITVGVDKTNKWFILDLKYGRWDSATLMDKVFAHVKEWNLQDFGIEKGLFKQVLEPFMMKEMQRRNAFFNIIPLEHGKIGTKLERIKLLQPRFKAHTVYMPMEAPWLGELKTELAGVTKDEIKSEYIDCVDALAMIEQVADTPFGINRDYDDTMSPHTRLPRYSREESLFVR
jgi:predicted phage terminase large subunit-like protein